MARTEIQLKVEGPSGPKIITVLSEITVDDLVRIGMKAYVHQVRMGVEYASPFSREVREAIVRVNAAQRV